jgi:hypothetical protein
MRPLLIPLFALLVACAPVRDPGIDDDDSAPDPTIEERLDTLDPGACAAGWSVDPAAQVPPLVGEGGQGMGTYGLWYAVECRVDVPVGLLSFTLDWFDPADGIDVPVQSLSINDLDDEYDPRDAELLDPGSVHLLEGTYEAISGWWEGEASFRQDDGTPISLLWLVFADAPMQGVAGR